MARVARKQSPTGMYHVVFRGINRQLVFEEDEDYERFLEILSGCKGAGAQGGYRLLGYCLMGNHIHLLVGCDGHPPGDILKRIAIRYVSRFNKKYGRFGHLFQGRYMSEPIKDDAQLLAVLRYIHQNPVKAGLCKRPQEYRFSSWAGYANGSGIADTALALGILSKDKQQQATAFESFIRAYYIQTK
jgi:REP element-mobilizing transposase RayT